MRQCLPENSTDALQTPPPPPPPTPLTLTCHFSFPPLEQVCRMPPTTLQVLTWCCHGSVFSLSHVRHHHLKVTVLTQADSKVCGSAKRMLGKAEMQEIRCLHLRNLANSRFPIQKDKYDTYRTALRKRVRRPTPLQ